MNKILVFVFCLVSDFALAGVTRPGVVPLGGMVAVMPTTHTTAWQPPTTGAIKDGFMRADGHTITTQNVADGSVFPVGTVLPSMVNQMTRGGTTSGTTGGQNEVTPTGTLAGNAVTRASWFKTSVLSATGPSHSHGAGTYSARLAGHDAGSARYQVRTTNVATWTSNRQFTNLTLSGNTTGGYIEGVVVAGSSDLNGTGSVSFSSTNNTMDDWAEAGSYTPSGSLVINQQSNLPEYTEVVWIIRVK